MHCKEYKTTMLENQTSPQDSNGRENKAMHDF